MSKDNVTLQERPSAVAAAAAAVAKAEAENALPDLVDTSRNGSDAMTCADAEQTMPLLDSFDSYIVVSVLTATASFAAMFDGDGNLEIFICAICSLSGIYATVIFSFSSIYGRTAVGSGKLVAYEQFLKETGLLRRRAFWMYLLSLVLFIVLLVIAATEKIEERYRLPFVGFLVVLSALSYRDWNRMIVAAGPIFAPVPRMELQPAEERVISGAPVMRSGSVILRSGSVVATMGETNGGLRRRRSTVREMIRNSP